MTTIRDKITADAVVMQNGGKNESEKDNISYCDNDVYHNDYNLFRRD